MCLISWVSNPSSIMLFQNYDAIFPYFGEAYLEMSLDNPPRSMQKLMHPVEASKRFYVESTTKN